MQRGHLVYAGEFLIGFLAIVFLSMPTLRWCCQCYVQCTLVLVNYNVISLCVFFLDTFIYPGTVQFSSRLVFVVIQLTVQFSSDIFQKHYVTCQHSSILYTSHIQTNHLILNILTTAKIKYKQQDF